MAIRIDMMRVFRAVARHGTLAAAAEALGRTPSAVSMTLSQLEHHLGAPLFDGDRKNRLSPLGLRVLEECDRALEAFERAEGAIGRHARSTAGTVRVVAVPSAAMTLLPAVIAAFRRDRPDVRLEIGDDDSATARRRLLLDEADIGIVSAPDTTPADEPGLKGTVLLRDRLGIVCRKGSAVEAEAGRGWDALDHAPLITNPLCALIDHATVQRLTEDSPLSAQNTTTLLSFVSAGLGATVLPRRVMADQWAELSFFAPDAPAVWRVLLTLTPAHRRLSPAAQAFLAALATVAARDMSGAVS